MPLALETNSGVGTWSARGQREMVRITMGELGGVGLLSCGFNLGVGALELPA